MSEYINKLLLDYPNDSTLNIFGKTRETINKDEIAGIPVNYLKPQNVVTQNVVTKNSPLHKIIPPFIIKSSESMDNLKSGDGVQMSGSGNSSISSPITSFLFSNFLIDRNCTLWSSCHRDNRPVVPIPFN
jgi:hypothetical protein